MLGFFSKHELPAQIRWTSSGVIPNLSASFLRSISEYTERDTSGRASPRARKLPKTPETAIGPR